MPKHPSAQVAVRINMDQNSLPSSNDLRRLLPVSHKIDAIVIPKTSIPSLNGVAQFIKDTFEKYVHDSTLMEK
jgi:hypothetical protein